MQKMFVCGLCNVYVEWGSYLYRPYRVPYETPNSSAAPFMSISLFFTAWNLDPVRTWLSPRKLGIVRISAESFTAADTFYESSHFPKPNSSALKKTCRNISASSKCTADQYYQFLVLRNDRNWYFENRPLSLGRPDTRTWNYTIETSRLISFFCLVGL